MKFTVPTKMTSSDNLIVRVYTPTTISKANTSISNELVRQYNYNVNYIKTKIIVPCKIIVAVIVDQAIKKTRKVLAKMLDIIRSTVRIGKALYRSAVKTPNMLL